jgi:hypothetical protein
MSTTYRPRRLSESEREQRRNAERERVKEAAEQLLTSEGWQRWVRARSMFRRYSAHNTMLLALDFHLRGIEPEPVAGFPCLVEARPMRAQGRARHQDRRPRDPQED